MRTEIGYSLLELLSVVAVLTIVVGIAAPNLLKARRHYQVQTTAQQIAQFLQEAKFVAVGKSAPRTLFFDSAQQTLRSSTGMVLILPANIRLAALPGAIAPPTLVAQAALNASALPGQAGDARSAISWPQGTTANRKELTFTGKGLPAVEPGVVHWIYLENQDGHHAVVTLTSMGGIAIQFWRGNQWQ